MSLMRTLNKLPQTQGGGCSLRDLLISGCGVIGFCFGNMSLMAFCVAGVEGGTMGEDIYSSLSFHLLKKCPL